MIPLHHAGPSRSRLLESVVMQTVAILGAGELGATLARRLAEAEVARRVVLVDADVGRAQGKALDLLQAGPVEDFDTRIAGCAALAEAGAADVIAVADPAGLPELGPGTPPSPSFVKELVAAAGEAALVIAGADPVAYVAAVCRAGLPRHRVIGSAPVAAAAALRRRLASELDAPASGVAVTVLGRPPDRYLLPRGTATLGGVPIERLSPVAERRALEGLRSRRLGPVSLAAGALAVIRALAGESTVLPVVALLDGELGHRKAALAVPARLGRGRLQSIVDFALDPVDKVAFDTLAERALAEA
jgi:malate dehydrogenase